MHDENAARDALALRLEGAVAGYESEHEPLPRPVMVVDLDAFDANADDLARRAASVGREVPIRVASKSLRVPALIQRALAHPGFSGVLGFTLAEALWLVENGVSDDVVVAYPTVDRGAIARLLASPEALAAVTVMVDNTAHLDVIDAVGRSAGAPVRVALDVDAGLKVAGQHIGPKRSPLFEASAVVRLARAIAERPGFQLVGVMTYEGQVAGVPDKVPGQRAKSFAVRKIKSLSLDQLTERRAEIAAGLQRITELEFWNAGGSGSIAETAADPTVTELTAGSGLLVSRLFDHYHSFEPRAAAFFGLPVTRRPGPGIATAHGGGLVASGAAGKDRLPTPWAPSGLSLTGLEGAGEVQTPLTGPGADGLAIGDLVWFRHAKSGEVFEHTNTAWLVEGDRIVEGTPTYRGHGLSF